jgi:hypothetical protein
MILIFKNNLFISSIFIWSSTKKIYDVYFFTFIRIKNLVKTIQFSWNFAQALFDICLSRKKFDCSSL